MFDLFETVYRDDDLDEYAEEMGDALHTTSSGSPRSNPLNYYKTYWRTHQISDHLPMWIELKINHTDAYLKRLLALHG